MGLIISTIFDEYFPKIIWCTKSSNTLHAGAALKLFCNLRTFPYLTLSDASAKRSIPNKCFISPAGNIKYL